MTAASNGTDPSPVLIERTGSESAPTAVAVVRLNSPDTRNALTEGLKVALRDALESVASDESVRAVVLASSGKTFCVGQDLREHAAALEEDASTALDTIPQHYNRIARALATMPKPVVASINGACVGAALGFALACDLRVCATGVQFATAFSGIGFGGDSALSASLARSVGASRAVELLMLGEAFGADRALEWGLVRELVDPSEVDEEAVALATRLAGGPTQAYAEIKKAVAAAETLPLDGVLEHEAAAQARLGLTEDHRSAVAAFLDKRKPEFAGR